jgi:hypothetical protein
MNSQWPSVVVAIASVIAAIGVVALFWQVILSKQLALTTFEDDLAREYREITCRIPVEALLGEELEEKPYSEALAWFNQYVDLSNEQVFLRQKKRVSRDTWKDWCKGIESNLTRRPAFAKAWAEIKRRSPDSFEELRRLEKGGFKEDPCSWH